MKVSGNNLLNVCKPLYKVSKDEKNDVYFYEGNMLGKNCSHQSTSTLLAP